LAALATALRLMFCRLPKQTKSQPLEFSLISGNCGQGLQLRGTLKHLRRTQLGNVIV